MSPHEIEKLLGGYATDTLSEEERSTLFAAALGNQALFDALADEQALRELLQDPPSRAHLLAALGEERVGLLARLVAWMRRPSALALAAAVAAGIVTLVVVNPRKPEPERPAFVAMSKPPQPEPAQIEAAPEGAPAPKPAAPKRSQDSPAVPNLKKAEPERNFVTTRNAPEKRYVLAEPPQLPPVEATPPSPKPPPPPAAQSTAAPAQPRIAATEQAQAMAMKRADTVRPGDAAALPGARDLYYAVQPSAVSGFLEPRTAKAKTRSFGQPAGVVGGVPSPAVARAGGVRYSILRRNSDGSFAEVDPTTVFAAGDALRVRFETNQAGNLGVMERQSNGLWTLRMGARTQPGQPVQMPSESTLKVGASSVMRFFVRFSRTLRSEPSLDSIAPTANLLRENAANAIYVVNPAWTPDAVVDFELTIPSK